MVYFTVCYMVVMKYTRKSVIERWRHAVGISYTKLCKLLCIVCASRLQ